MTGPTQNCACASTGVAGGTCALPTAPVVFDAVGNCHCGKPADTCCRSGEAKSNANDALGELCAPHGGQNVCS